MTALKPIDPITLADRLKRGELTLVDIREADEFAREHIAGALSLPMSRVAAGGIDLEPHGNIAFHCRSGMRTQTNCATLASHVHGDAFSLEGGLDAWKKVGLPVKTDARAPMEIQRQVQITAGALVLAGAILAAVVHPAFVALSGVVGLGLFQAGITGWCGMARALAAAPWNRRTA